MLLCGLSRRSFESNVLVLTVRSSQGEFIVSLLTGISSDLDIVGQYDVLCKTGFDPVLIILLLQRFPKVDLDSYAAVEHLFMGYGFATGDV